MRIVFFILPFILFCWSCSNGEKTPEFKLNTFPDVEYAKVVAYKMNGDNKTIINKQNTLSNAAVDKGMEMTKEQIDLLLAIYHDKATYGNNIYRCFRPHLGFVFYDEKNKVVAHSTVCFECNWMRTSPDIGAFIFSRKGAQRLIELEGGIFKM